MEGRRRYKGKARNVSQEEVLLFCGESLYISMKCIGFDECAVL